MARSSRDRRSGEQKQPTPRGSSSRKGEPSQEASRQTAELAAFRRMLVLSEGTFSLNFSVYNIRRLRDELIQQLTSQLSGIALVHLPPGTSDVLAVVRDGIGGDVPRAIFVFWLADYAALLLATTAIDFWRYRSHSFEFTAAPLEVGQWQTEKFPGFDMIHGLPFQEKAVRRAELEQRIEQAGSPPSREMLPHVLGWMLELAELLQRFNDYAAAESLARDAVAMCEARYGSKDPILAASLSNLAQLLQVTNRPAEAELIMRRALAIDEKAYGADHPETATDLNNLAQLLKATNRLAEAEPMMRRALLMDERAYGAEHPAVARDLNNLALLLQATNRLAEAEPMMRRALAILRLFGKATGYEHPQMPSTVDSYRKLLTAMNLPPDEIERRVRE